MMVMGRHSRHTFGIMSRAGRFSVSVPKAGEMKEQLIMAGTLSGRDVDKFDGHGLSCLPGREDGIYVVEDCAIHVECVIRHMQDMTEEFLDESVRSRAYMNGDLHRLYFGEILSCYRTG